MCGTKQNSGDHYAAMGQRRTRIGRKSAGLLDSVQTIAQSGNEGKSYDDTTVATDERGDKVVCSNETESGENIMGSRGQNQSKWETDGGGGECRRKLGKGVGYKAIT